MMPGELTCYICKKTMEKAHSSYGELCKACGDFNAAKRNQTADLGGYTALVTGGRIKIGFQTALKLLRCHAGVIVTSRFPADAATRFSRQPDFNKWQKRLRIYGLDMRVIADVNSFIDYYLHTVAELDVLVNNAAQTVRKPPAFYRHLLAAEGDDGQLSNESLKLIVDSSKPKKTSNSRSLLDSSSQLCLYEGNLSYSGLNSAQLSQVPILDDDRTEQPHLFPENKYDKDGQQEDRRPVNSWMHTLDEVDPLEFTEVLYINLLTPFLLNTRLKALLEESDRPAFIINVTAMEGNFHDPNKDPRHPHTNMAKAALNMMTRTSAVQYAKTCVYMNSVDTGWITNEKPWPLGVSSEQHKQRMAIDEMDGAARILDPIFTAINEAQFEYGKLFKNYHSYPW